MRIGLGRELAPGEDRSRALERAGSFGMSLPHLTIEREEGREEKRKTRIFSVYLLGYLLADVVWEAGASASVRRPAWIAYFGTEQESRPFTANFRASHKASTPTGTLQVAKRASYRWQTQRVPGGVVTTAYLPQLFHLEPTMPDEDLRFVFAPPRWWIDEQARELAPDFGEDALETARAALFAAYLDRRTHLPILDDLRFHLRLFRAAREEEWVLATQPYLGASQRFYAEGVIDCGLDEPLAVRVGHEAFAAFLTRETALYYQEELRHAETRIVASGRILPFPEPPAAQLRLDFAVA